MLPGRFTVEKKGTPIEEKNACGEKGKEAQKMKYQKKKAPIICLVQQSDQEKERNIFEEITCLKQHRNQKGKSTFGQNMCLGNRQQQ